MKKTFTCRKGLILDGNGVDRSFAPTVDAHARFYAVTKSGRIDHSGKAETLLETRRWRRSGFVVLESNKFCNVKI